MRKLTFLIVIAALALAQAVQAQDARKKGAAARAKLTKAGKGWMQRYDQDGDGQITAQEFKGSDELFQRLDEDGSGALSEEEVARSSRVAQELTWEKVDKAAMFKQIDKDNDGVITTDEFGAARLNEIVNRAMAKAKAELFGKGKAQQKAKRGKASVTARYDKDGDGRVSREEFPEARMKAFDRLDQNGDGFIDEAEMQTEAGRKAKRDKRAGKEARQGKKRKKRDAAGE